MMSFDDKRIFVIVGVQKCGTTFLYNILRQHPSIFVANKKELNFFNLNYYDGIDAYKENFSKMTSENVYGEASPNYLANPNALKRLAQHFPDAKIIMLTRNPLERAYSHYWHEVKLGYEYLTFQEALEAEEARLSGEWEKMMVDPSYYSFNYDHYSYVTRGKYSSSMELISRFFPEKNIFKTETSELSKNKKLQNLLSFLGVENHDFSQHDLEISYRGLYPKMSEEASKNLLRYWSSNH